jgi:hypothetical protein
METNKQDERTFVTFHNTIDTPEWRQAHKGDPEEAKENPAG